MEAQFIKKYIFSIICLCCGLFLTVILILCIVNNVNAFKVAPGIVFGVLYTIGSLFSLFFNHKAHLCVKDGSIKGNYHLWGKIDCNISSVSFTGAHPNTLTIQLKNGKIYRIFGVSNSFELSSVIRRGLTYEMTESPEKLKESLAACQAERKKELIYVITGVALMFVNLFVSVLLTGARELYEFSTTDWTVFAIFGVLEAIIIFIVFFMAFKVGKKILTVEKIEYDVRRRTIETTPLLPGNAIKVFADELYTTRIIVFGFPNTDSIYYTVERIGFDYSLREEGKSKIYEGIGPLPFDSQALTDVSEKFGC